MNAVNVLIFSIIGFTMMMMAAFGMNKYMEKRSVLYTRRGMRAPHGLGRNGWLIVAGCSILYSVVISSGFLYFGQSSKTADIEILNGQIVGKEKERVSCEHDYQCNCRPVTTCTGSGQNQSCSTTTVCDTCYEHSHDYDWNLKTDIKDITIERIDRQGVNTPPRWAAAKNGEPVAIPHKYINWVKAVPDSLFHGNDKTLIETYGSQIPTYPNQIYDYHRINRVITNGVPLESLMQWNMDLSLMLRELGPLKQANIILIFTKSPDPNLANAIRSAWLGGKKNDITIVVGVPEYPKISWAAVNAWTDKEIFKIQLRDDIITLGNVNRETMLTAIYNNVKKDFVRKPMVDYSYLKDSIVIENSVIIFMMIVMLLFAGLTVFKTKLLIEEGV